MIKFFSILLILILFTIPTVNAITLSDKTGLKFEFPIKTDERVFTIDGTSNFDIKTLDFNKNEKSITLNVESSIETNLLEIVIPSSLIGGDFRFFIDDVEIFPKSNQGKHSTFATIEFSGIGQHTITLQGTTYLDIFDVYEKIDYTITGGEIKTINSNPSTNSLIISLTNVTNPGTLSIKLTNDVILPFENNEFLVMMDGTQSDYSIADNMMNIKFNSNSNKITIIGTYVIPEFYEITPLVLATSFIGLIVLKKYKKLFV